MEVRCQPRVGKDPTRKVGTTVLRQAYPMSGESQAQGRVNQITSNTKSTMMITRFSKSDMLHLNFSFSARSPLQGETPAGWVSQNGQC